MLISRNVKGRGVQWHFIFGILIIWEQEQCHTSWHEHTSQHHDWMKGEKGTWLSQKEAKAGWQCWRFPVPGCGCQGSYLVCMFGKRLCAGHHAGSPFIQLAQLLSPLIQGDARTGQVPNDPSRRSPHALNPAGSRDVLGEAARGFSCRGLANCKGEMDRQTDRDELLAWSCQCSLMLSCRPAAVTPSEGHVWKLCSVTITCAVQPYAPHSDQSWSREVAKVKLWNGRQGPSLSSTRSTFSFHQSSKSCVLLHS